jgi:hypothetical protein
MRKNVVAAVLAMFSFIILAPAQQAAAPAAPAEPASEAAGRLPVKRVVLYKNGVGYFEHSTHVRGTQDLNIDFTSAQLNDALKSLTVVDLGDGRITGVRFNSVAPLSERLKSLPLPLSAKASRNDLLKALRGTRVEVRNGSTSATGKVLALDVEKKSGAKPQEVEDVTVLTLVTDAGEVRSFNLGPETTVRIADRELADDVNRYLNLIGSSKAADLRRLTISAAGTGEREIFVSYISEVPVWKSTYRILMDAKNGQKPLVQGWAVVDNTIGEDWKDVQLSLVAGAPQSFVQNISQPLYVRRPEVPLPQSAMLTPQTHESAIYAVAPSAPAPLPPVLLPRTVVGGVGGGIGSGSGAGFGPRAGGGGGGGVAVGTGENLLRVPSAGLSMNGMALADKEDRFTAEAEARAVGDFFQYDLKEKVTIGKNQSALVPILQARIEAEKVTLWNEDSDEPLRALWLNNTSGVEFDAGSFNILDEGTFAGEGMIDAVRPGEKRLISYAADSAVKVKAEEDSSAKPYSRLAIAKGIMTLTREDRQTKTYTISNSDTSPRDVIIEHPDSPDWKLAEGLKPEETSASFYRFRVKVDPKTSQKLVVEEYQPVTSQVELTDLPSGFVGVLTEQKRLTPAIEQAIKRVLDQKGVIAGFDEQIKTRQQEESSIANDQSRIRENMKALKGSPEEKALLQRYTHQLDEQEDRLAALRSQTADLKAKRQEASDQLDKILAEISLDERF